jgi:hypothetical protein
MKKLAALALVVLLVGVTWGGPDNLAAPALPMPDPNSIPVSNELLAIADGSGPFQPLSVRTAALDNLSKLARSGKLSPTQTAVVVGVLKRLLVTQTLPVCDEEKDIFAMHVVAALGSFGPDALPALPALATLRGGNAVLNKWVDDTVAVISAPAAAPAQPMPTLTWQSDSKLAVAFVYSGLGIALSMEPYARADNLSLTIKDPFVKATQANVTFKFTPPAPGKPVEVALPTQMIDPSKATTLLFDEKLVAQQFVKSFAKVYGPEATNPMPGQITVDTAVQFFDGTGLALSPAPIQVTGTTKLVIAWIKAPK